MFERRFLPRNFRHDFFAEFVAILLAVASAITFYAFVGLVLRNYLDIPYWDLVTPFVVYSQFLQDSVLGVLAALVLGVMLAVVFVAKLVVYLLVEDFEPVQIH